MSVASTIVVTEGSPPAVRLDAALYFIERDLKAVQEYLGRHPKHVHITEEDPSTLTGLLLDLLKSLREGLRYEDGIAPGGPGNAQASGDAQVSD